MPPSLHISLPEGLKEYVCERVAEEHYGTASEYVRALIREDQKKRHGERRLEQHIETEVAHGLAEPKPQSS
jgi:antitoxin ParD1/3/4